MMWLKVYQSETCCEFWSLWTADPRSDRAVPIRQRTSHGEFEQGGHTDDSDCRSEVRMPLGPATADEDVPKPQQQRRRSRRDQWWDQSIQHAGNMIEL